MTKFKIKSRADGMVIIYVNGEALSSYEPHETVYVDVGTGLFPSRRQFGGIHKNPLLLTSRSCEDGKDIQFHSPESMSVNPDFLAARSFVEHDIEIDRLEEELLFHRRRRNTADAVRSLIRLSAVSPIIHVYRQSIDQKYVNVMFALAKRIAASLNLRVDIHTTLPASYADKLAWLGDGDTMSVHIGGNKVLTVKFNGDQMVAKDISNEQVYDPYLDIEVVTEEKMGE